MKEGNGMKETHWRSKLIKLFKETHPNEFIWAMDAKFKAGFPDLLVIVDGRTIHYELKAVSFCSFDNLGFFKPIQLSIIRAINRAGGDARGLIRFNMTDQICLVDAAFKQHIFNSIEFTEFWSGDHHW